MLFVRLALPDTRMERGFVQELFQRLLYRHYLELAPLEGAPVV